jgi:hypothetical protein
MFVLKEMQFTFPLNVGIISRSRLCCTLNIYYAIFFLNDYLFKDQGNEIANANGVCE